MSFIVWLIIGAFVLIHALQISAVDCHPDCFRKWIPNDWSEHCDRRHDRKGQRNVDLRQRERQDNTERRDDEPTDADEVDREGSSPVARFAFEVQAATRAVVDDRRPALKDFAGSAARASPSETAHHDCRSFRLSSRGLGTDFRHETPLIIESIGLAAGRDGDAATFPRGFAHAAHCIGIGGVCNGAFSIGRAAGDDRYGRIRVAVDGN